MNARYDVTSIMDYLRNQPDINPDDYDGSYELLRETVQSYIVIKDDPMLDYHDLNALYFMVIGTWKHGIDRKKAVIQDSHLPEAEKTRLMAVINRIWERVCARKYIHQRDSNPPRMGMFGTGFMTFKGKAPDHCASAFVRMCAEIFPLTDEEVIFQRVEQVLTHGFRGMQSASVSVILHCMKPDVFPILNGNMGTDNIFDTLGLRLYKRGESSTYIANCRIIRAFRDQNFTFRNYRVFDTAQHAMTRFVRDSVPVRDTGENTQRGEMASLATTGNDGSLESEPKRITERILSELAGSDDTLRVASYASQTSLYYHDVIFARIFYCTDALRLEMYDIPAVHVLYDELQAESIAFQKPTADPYATPGKYSFFIKTQDVETALVAIVIAVREGKLVPETAQSRKGKPQVPLANSVGKRAEKRIIIDGHEYIVYGVDAAPDGNGYPHMVDAVTGLTPRGNQSELMKQYLIARGIVPSKKANTHWCCNAILTLDEAASPNLLAETPFAEEKPKPAAETENQALKGMADLKRLGYDELRERFIRWCQDSGFAPSAYMTFVSDCFYLWRKEDPSRFWLAVESDDAIMYDMLYQSLRKNSSGDAEKNVPGYARAIRRFRQFAASWMNGEQFTSSNGTAKPAPQHAIQPTTAFAASDKTVQPMYSDRTSVPGRTPEIGSRLEKKLDSIIGAIATMYSGKSSAAETDVQVQAETDKRFRIESTQGNGPMLMLKTRPTITGLIFSLKLCAVGLETCTERYQLFFTNKESEPMSEPQEIEVVAGKEYLCRFELKSCASEEKGIYLAIRSVKATPDEVRQLIEIPVKIAFAADFGL